MTQQPIVIGAGIACIDHIFTSPQPSWGDQAIVSEYKTVGGGLIGNAMAACGRLGARAAIYTILGDDSIGDQILEDLDAEHVDTTFALRAPNGKSPFSFIHVDSHTRDRTIFHRPGTGLAPDFGALDLTPISEANALLVDDVYPDLSLAAARTARSHGVPVLADLTPGADNARILRYVDILIAPSHFVRSIGPEGDELTALAKIHALGPTTAVITLGKRGWIASSADGIERGDAFTIDVADTTGAGDAFHGAFAFGIASGWNIRKCGTFASAVAALKCAKTGGRAGLPTRPEVIAFLAERGIPQ